MKTLFIQYHNENSAKFGYLNNITQWFISAWFQWRNPNIYWRLIVETRPGWYSPDYDLTVFRQFVIDSRIGLTMSVWKHNKRNSLKENKIQAKANIKPLQMRLWADQEALPWSDTTKPPKGVAMVRVSQVPKWCIGITPIKRCSDGSGSTKAPKWCCGTRPIKRRDYGSDVTTSPQVMLWHYADQEV